MTADRPLPLEPWHLTYDEGVVEINSAGQEDGFASVWGSGCLHPQAVADLFLRAPALLRENERRATIEAAAREALAAESDHEAICVTFAATAYTPRLQEHNESVRVRLHAAKERLDDAKKRLRAALESEG